MSLCRSSTFKIYIPKRYYGKTWILEVQARQSETLAYNINMIICLPEICNLPGFVVISNCFPVFEISSIRASYASARSRSHHKSVTICMNSKNTIQLKYAMLLANALVQATSGTKMADKCSKFDFLPQWNLCLLSIEWFLSHFKLWSVIKTIFGVFKN